MPVVETERHGQIFVVRMNRPERLNALNEEMRTELRELTRALGITSFFVTHDQVEALADSLAKEVFHAAHASFRRGSKAVSVCSTASFSW